MNWIKYLAAGLTFLIYTANTAAQKQHFLYLQTEDSRPFFVMLNKKNYSSSAVGHAIIPQLSNGVYNISIGFAGQSSSQEYAITIDNQDQGYIIKSFEEGKRYGLLNLQTAQVQMSGALREAALAQQKAAEEAAALRRQQEEALQKEAAAAAALQQQEAATLKARQDSVNTAAAIAAAAPPEQAEKAIAQPKEVAAETKKAASKQEDAANAKAAGTAAPKSALPEALPAVAAAAIVVADATAKTDTAVSAPAAVAAAPLSAAEIARLQEEARRLDAQGKRDSVMKAASTKPASDPRFLDMDFTMPADSVKTDTTPVQKPVIEAPLPEGKVAADTLPVKNATPAVAPVVVPASAKSGVPPDSVAAAKQPETPAAATRNTNCVQEATDADIELVGMLIKSEKDVEESLELARKTMKLKCATTAQVRTLALLFNTDEERYRLLDAAYRYTSDRQNFAALSDLLKDPYYVGRFKAMLQ